MLIVSSKILNTLLDEFISTNKYKDNIAGRISPASLVYDYLDEFDKWWEVYKRNCGMENYGLSHYYKTMDYHFYYLHYFVNTLDRKDSYLLVIKNYDEFLSKDLDIKAQYEEKCVEKILRYYDEVAGQCYATDYKKFNILLVK